MPSVASRYAHPTRDGSVAPLDARVRLADEHCEFIGHARPRGRIARGDPKGGATMRLTRSASAYSTCCVRSKRRGLADVVAK